MGKKLRDHLQDATKEQKDDIKKHYGSLLDHLTDKLHKMADIKKEDEKKEHLEKMLSYLKSLRDQLHKIADNKQEDEIVVEDPKEILLGHLKELRDRLQDATKEQKDAIKKHYGSLLGHLKDKLYKMADVKQEDEVVVEDPGRLLNEIKIRKPKVSGSKSEDNEDGSTSQE